MARLLRVLPVDVPVHVIQRGNNRQVCFAAEQDFRLYADWLTQYSRKNRVDVHAWVFMNNHAHLLCTPRQEDAISLMMQSLGRRYVRYFNNKYERSGTLWEGRFKSCLVQEELYFFGLCRYIELNPVRAKMVVEPGQYMWSSYGVNAHGAHSRLWSAHPVYQSLGASPLERQKNYRAMFADRLEEDFVSEIRENTNKGLAVGTDAFKEKLGAISGRRLRAKRRGRPYGSKKVRN